MSLIISHRGLLNGPDPKRDNNPDAIREVLKMGFQCEVDVRFDGANWWLGHDKAQYKVDRNFLGEKKLWVHAKDLKTLHELKNRGSLIHYFFHDKDDATLTSQGWIWTYPGKELVSNRSICVLPEKFPKIDWKVAGGVCTDYPDRYRNIK